MTNPLSRLGEYFTCQTPQGGWGGAPWGGSPWGGSAAASAFLCLVYALAIKENVVRLYFSEPIYWTNHGDPDDGAGIDHYNVLAEGGVGIDSLPVRPDSAVSAELVANSGSQQVDVTVDRAFSPIGTTYRAIVNGLRSTTGKILGVGANTVVFDGLQVQIPTLIPDLAIANRDIANPQTLSALYDPIPEAGTLDDSILGTLRADAQGDIAFDEGLVSFKKRVFRRLTFLRNRTGHLQGYGLGLPNSVKRLARPGVINALSAEAEEQIRQEPETVDVRASVSVTPSGVSFFRVWIKTNIGRTVNWAVPLSFSPTEESSA